MLWWGWEPPSQMCFNQLNNSDNVWSTISDENILKYVSTWDVLDIDL